MGDRKFVRQNPNARIDQRQARKRGLAVFRDIHGCPQGHVRAWRWRKPESGRECLSCKWGLPTDRPAVAPSEAVWRAVLSASPGMSLTESEARVLGVPVYRDSGVCQRAAHVQPWRWAHDPYVCLTCRWGLPGRVDRRARRPDDLRGETQYVVEANPYACYTQETAGEMGITAYRGAVPCGGCGWLRPWRHTDNGACLTCRWKLGEERG